MYRDRPADHDERSKSRNFTRNNPAIVQQYQSNTARSARNEDNLERASRRSHTPSRAQLETHNVEPTGDRPRTPVNEGSKTPTKAQASSGHHQNDTIHQTQRSQQDQLLITHHRDGFGHNYASVDRIQPLRQQAFLAHEDTVKDAESRLHLTYYGVPAGTRPRRDSLERGNFYDGYHSQPAPAVERTRVSEVHVEAQPPTPRAEVEAVEDPRGQAFQLESQLKKEYQQRLDEYHRYVDELNFQNKSKSQIKLAEAEAARRHAALIQEEKRLELLRDKEKKRIYKQMLDEQQIAQYKTFQGEKEIEVQTER